MADEPKRVEQAVVAPPKNKVEMIENPLDPKFKLADKVKLVPAAKAPNGDLVVPKGATHRVPIHEFANRYYAGRVELMAAFIKHQQAAGKHLDTEEEYAKKFNAFRLQTPEQIIPKLNPSKKFKRNKR